MKHSIIITALVTSTLFCAGAADARRVVVRTPRARVVVHTGFPIHRALPEVVVRTGPVVRVAPHTYLTPVVFTGVVVKTLPPATAWNGAEVLDRDDGWTDFTLDVDRRGSQLLMQIENGPARINFAEVVFENGETQVVDFNEKVESRGVYSVLDFRDGRKIDHVRVVARAAGRDTRIAFHLVA